MSTDDIETIELDAMSFTSAERLECQIQFDSEFSDLLDYLFTVINPKREGPVSYAIIDRENRRHFSDEILAYFVWVQAKRADPDTQLETYTELAPGVLQVAHVRGLLKDHGRENGKPKKSQPTPVSSGSTGEGSP
jgi:hypothetical protein